MVTCTGHIGIHEGTDGRTDVDDVMAIKPNFLTSMGYHAPRALAFGAGGVLLQEGFTYVDCRCLESCISEDHALGRWSCQVRIQDFEMGGEFLNNGIEPKPD